MAENQKLRQDSSELRALVHTSQAGLFTHCYTSPQNHAYPLGAIIGKGGDRVKELRYDYQ